MVTAYYPKLSVPLDIAYRNMQINMFWDGLFHDFTWLTTCTGVFLLWRAGQRPDVPWSSKAFAGSLPLGWGLFNVVEGIVDHSILHMNHVTETPNHLVWDMAFLGFGATLIAIGLVTIRAAKRDGRELENPHPSTT